MAWSMTDVEGSKPSYLSAADKAKTVFVSIEEAVLKTNKDKGITNGGWWLINSHVDQNGNTRYKSECLVSMAVTNAVSGDAADDAIAADVEVVITIGTQPVAQNTLTGGATFTVVATASSGTLAYQWQKALVTAPTKFANIGAATTDTLALTGLLEADSGNLYRVVLSTDNGAVKVKSDAAAVTFVS